MLGGSFFDPVFRTGFFLIVGPVPTLFPKTFLLPGAIGIALLPVAAFLSPEETHSKTNLPEGVVMAARAVKWLLEEEAISKNLFVGGRGLVTIKKNALDYHAHQEFSTPLIDIE